MSLERQVTLWLNGYVGQRLMWKSGGMTIAGGMSTDDGLDNVTDITTTPLSCYEIVLWAARRCGVTRSLVWGFIDDIFRASAQKNALTAASFPAGLSSYYFTYAFRMFSSYPKVGDVVLFSAGATRYLAHVAVATGKKYDVLSFGHDGPINAPATGVPLTLQRMTIHDILLANPALDKVEYGRPVW